MKKLFDKIKKNNKGFTLVELIVVVAILAVITVVVAPQYLNYVDKARQGTDENAIGEIAHVAEIAYVEETAKLDPGETEAPLKITLSIVSGTVTYGDALADAVEEVIPASQYTFKSEKYSNCSLTITVTNGVSDWDPATSTVTTKTPDPDPAI